LQKKLNEIFSPVVFTHRVSTNSEALNGNIAVNAESSDCSPGFPQMTYWDRVAQTTRWGRYVTEIQRQVIEQGEAYAGPPGKAVDLGCGGGRWSKMLAERGWEMTCIDVSSQSLDICKRNVATANCILAQAKDRTIPLASNAVSLALCIEVVPLIEADWFAPEVHRILSDSGIFIGVYINGRSLRGMASRLKNRLVSGESSYTFYQSRYDLWKCRLLKTGFEMLHEESCCWGPFTRNSNSPFVPAFAKVERAVGLHRVVTFSPWVVFIARKQPTGSHG
jgi:SAM-dependent methyltransferase